MLADRGYDSDDVRSALLLRGIVPVNPPRSNRKHAIDCDFRAYRDRNRVARLFNSIKQFRRIATRYDKTALSFLSFPNIAAARIWLPSYVNRTEPGIFSPQRAWQPPSPSGSNESTA